MAGEDCVRRSTPAPEPARDDEEDEAKLEEGAPVERGVKDGAWPDQRVDGGVKSDAERVRAGGVGVGVEVEVGVNPCRSLERVRGDAGVEAFDRLMVRDEEEVGVGETGSSS